MKWYRKKWVKILGGVIILIAAIFTCIYFSYHPANNITWGVTYSPTYAQYLGLDPQVTFNELLSELQPHHVRLVTYWETLEPQPGQFDFTSIDTLLNAAEKSHADILLVIGHKQPRWPECHHPAWFEQLTPQQQQQAVLAFLTAEINHFKTYSNVSRWQVENEPTFPYGDNCPPHNQTQLKQEVDLVKSLDSRPIVLTDSGEKGDWFRVAALADVFGSTMYRTVYNPRYGGYISYHLPPLFYRLRAGLLQLLTPTHQIIGVELQAEPWFAKDIHDTTLAEQKQLMNPQIFAANAAYARKVGFSENYFWGVEWWYWLKQQQNDPSMVAAAKQVLNP